MSQVYLIDQNKACFQNSGFQGQPVDVKKTNLQIATEALASAIALGCNVLKIDNHIPTDGGPCFGTEPSGLTRAEEIQRIFMTITSMPVELMVCEA